MPYLRYLVACADRLLVCTCVYDSATSLLLTPLQNARAQGPLQEAEERSF